MKRPDDLQMWLFEPVPAASKRPETTETSGAMAVATRSARPRVAVLPADVDKARVEVPLLLRLRLDTAEMGTPEIFFHRLNGCMEGRLERLILTDNRTSILNARPDRKGLRVRLHWSFAGASDDLLAQVAAFAEGRLRGVERQRTLTALRHHFRAHGSALPGVDVAGGGGPPAARTRRPRLQPIGDCFDLRQLRDEVNETYFDGQLFVHITWGKVPVRRRGDRRRGRGPKRRTIHLGTYTPELNLVRIHRKLDQPWVPRHVVESVVYHEMLHADIPVVEKNGRRQLHTAEFRRREKLFARYVDAEAWLRTHLPRLLQ